MTELLQDDRAERGMTHMRDLTPSTGGQQGKTLNADSFLTFFPFSQMNFNDHVFLRHRDFRTFSYSNQLLYLHSLARELKLVWGGGVR